MRAAYIERTGSPDVIRVGELPIPELGDRDVRVRVEAVSVNPIDTYIRSGAVSMQLPFPFVIGCDLAGRVDAVGTDVTDLRPGTRVWASNQGLLGRQGTFSEFAVVDRDWLHVLPDSVSAEDAAAVALVAITAHLGLFRDARLRSGETILVVGGTGGVGSMVVQMAKAAGARVVATAGSDEKVDLAVQLGADDVIGYHREPIGPAIQRLVPEGVNVFWETRREPDFDLAIASMAQRGRMVLMAGREARPPFPVGPFYLKECSLHGMVMFKASAEEVRSAGIDISGWLADRILRANISALLALDDAAESHRLQESATLDGSGKLAGKIVLKI